MNIGKILVLIGLFSIVCGLIIILFGNKLTWFGNTPFDFKYEGKNTRVYAPIGSMLLLSIFVSLITNFILRFFK
jgi:hypothetical protein